AADGPVALVGPTGSGKSALAMAVAETLDAEIVAVDAFTVYRGMDVGTAKPTPAERRRCRHHMIDVLSPQDQCSVEWFQSAARAAIHDVTVRGRTPLLVGGSGLYFRAVVDPLEFPPTDAAVRAAVEERYRDAPTQAHADLAIIDPEAAARIDPGNVRRAVRALEVYDLTGRPFSDWRRAWDRWDSVYDSLTVVGVGMDRPTLAAALDRRVDSMVAQGWLDEARRLAQQPLSATARHAIGYAELLDHLAGGVALERAVEQIKARTRHYAVRQDRWFRTDPRVQWTTADDAPDLLRTLCTS
ncbi:MAG: tRNA (adenosine(37)-N6)-dimethylallyltransferase MiaA, partial [Nitriliruptorales bacterium]|nr:tRNA (adenosine(37)-N6)-dimethylallyltransferase MiaA [Nitriliruptorales bacterium]